MAILTTAALLHRRAIELLAPLDGVPPLLLRLILAPVMIQAGWNKVVGFESTVAWFGNDDWGLGLPAPTLMAALAAGTELVGGAALLVGLGTRLFAVPLAITMSVAMFAVHWPNGWLAIADASSWLASDRVLEAAERKSAAIAILKEHGDYAWLTARGSFTILNNGIEFAATYFVMLVTLVFTGGGRFTSFDHFIGRALATDSAAREEGNAWAT